DGSGASRGWVLRLSWCSFAPRPGLSAGPRAMASALFGLREGLVGRCSRDAELDRVVDHGRGVRPVGAELSGAGTGGLDLLTEGRHVRDLLDVLVDDVGARRYEEARLRDRHR